SSNLQAFEEVLPGSAEQAAIEFEAANNGEPSPVPVAGLDAGGDAANSLEAGSFDAEVPPEPEELLAADAMTTTTMAAAEVPVPGDQHAVEPQRTDTVHSKPEQDNDVSK
ncbi:MAG: hypothetical protein Q7U14_06215, partial [Lacisediminimonas sp.]|nr:hypothetical protein [Lacisediminimonas sp.]